ncbi:unnamed protein product [Polarella glacialis]|uniref:Uncharacterized protein n=1 Tax=Polarella glacialis TaxID=89957 RepID=A0A813GBJ0_POLGL|nr:unnamed protein product [Polarella glacialis]
MPGKVHSDINSDWSRIDTWSSSGWRQIGIENCQIIRDLQTPQMPSAAGASACCKASGSKWFALQQSLTCGARCDICDIVIMKAPIGVKPKRRQCAWHGKPSAREAQWRYAGRLCNGHL